MGKEVIQELLEKANADSKKSLTKEEQRKYRDALIECLKETGIDNDTVSFYISGVKYNSTSSFVVWNRAFNEKEQAENFEKLMNNEKLKSLDNVGKLRVAFSLLVSELGENPQNDIIVGEIFHWLVELSYKKDGTRLSNLGVIFKTCFMNNINYNFKLPSLDKFGFTKEYLHSLLQLLEEAVDNSAPKGEKEIVCRNNIRDWVRREKEKSGLFEGEPDASGTNIRKDVITIPRKPDILGKAVGNKQVSGKNGVAKKLIAIANEIESIDNELIAAREDLKKSEKEISKLNMEIKKSSDLYRASIDENTKLRMEIAEEKKKSSELESANKELEDRVNRQVGVIDIYDQDKANTKDEILNQIAASLKKIYTDYKTAENMEMTLDLGENMRDSLDDVFRKLKKIGIDIEGR